MTAGRRDVLIRAVASFGFVGYSPLAPGTAGSLVAAILAWFMPPAPLAVAAIAATLVGLAVSAPSRLAFGSKDPSAFVLDEVAGMWIALVFLPKLWPVYAAAFVLFRVLDIWKPGPIGWADRQPSPFGIVWDDAIAGVFVNLILQIVLRF